MVSRLLIPVASAAEFRREEARENYFIAVVPVAKLPVEKIPLDANLRRANKKAKIAREIYQTLMTEPQEFLKRNLGITLIAENAYFKYHEKTENPMGIWVEMISSLHGVANGGHTLAAIKMAVDDKIDVGAAYVDLKIIVGIKDEELKEAVVGLNSSERVDRRSILYKKGEFRHIQAALQIMGFDKVYYYQNQDIEKGCKEDPRQSVLHVVKLLAAIDKKRSNPDKMDHPVYVIGGGSNLLRRSSLERAEKLIFDFLPVAVEIEKRIYKLIASDPKRLPGVKNLEDGSSFDNFSRTLDGTSFSCAIPSTYAFPVVAAFREFVEDDEWVVPIKEIIEPAVKALWKEYSTILRREYDSQNRSFGSIIRNANLWIKLYNVANGLHKEYLRNKILAVDENENNGNNGDRNSSKPKPITLARGR